MSNSKALKVFLFFLIIISLFTVTCYADDSGYPSESDITADKLGYLYKKFESGKSTGGTTVQLDTKVRDLRNDYAEKMQKACKNDFEGLDFITNVTVKGHYFVFNEDGSVTNTAYEKTSPITEIDTSFLDLYTGTAGFTVEFKVKDTKYTINTYTTKYYDEANQVKYDRLSCEDANEKAKGKIGENTRLILNTLSDAAYTGVIAGSVGAGYNVGTVYSNRQVALSEVVEKTSGFAETTDESGNKKTESIGKYNEFKEASYLRYSFSYYMSPIFGKMDAVTYADIFGESQDTKWLEMARALNPSPIAGGTININADYKAFAGNISEDEITEDGYKITTGVKFGNGAQKFKGVNASDTPQTVVSYNLRIAYPYLFAKSGSLYSMSTNSLRIDNDYTFNVYNEKFYDSGMKEVVSRPEIPYLGMEDMFLYRQIVDGNSVGVIIIGSFQEAVVDTSSSEKTFYATGRQVGFNNGYSSQLDLNHANKELMYCVGDSGQEGYLPKNAAFTLTDEEKSALENNLNAMGEAESQGKSQVVTLKPRSFDEIFEELSKINNHPYIADAPTAFKFNIVFVQLENKKALKELEKEQSNEQNQNNQNNENNENQEVNVTPADNFKQWAFCIVRNNRYVNDKSLTSWLRTNKAKSIPYVDAQTLLNKIQGNFAENLAPLTYTDWKKMQSIKAELETNKSMWLVRILNTMSILMGVFLIIFAILICLAYWIDIFNTFTDFSILQFISSGRLYPIESEHLGDFINKKSETTKYVTFKDVLIMAGIMVAVGVLFMNVSYVVYLISCLYNYILDVFGGV